MAFITNIVMQTFQNEKITHNTLILNKLNCLIFNI